MSLEEYDINRRYKSPDKNFLISHSFKYSVVFLEKPLIYRI